MRFIVVTDADTGLAAQRVWTVSDEQADAVVATLGEPDGTSVVDLDAIDTSVITLLGSDR